MPVLSQRVLAPDLTGTEAIFSRDVTKAAFVNGQQIVVIDRTGARQLFDLGSGSASQLDFSPDGSRVMFTYTPPSGPSQVRLLDIATGTVTPLGMAAGVIEESNSASFSADGTKVVFASSQALVAEDTNGLSDIYVVDLASGVVTRVSTTSSGEQANQGSFDPVFSPDGTKIAFESDATNFMLDLNSHRDIFQKTLDTGAIILVSTRAGSSGEHFYTNSFDPVYAPNGSFVMFTNGANLYYKTPGSLLTTTVFYGFSSFVTPIDVDVAPDSSHIVYVLNISGILRTLATGVNEPINVNPGSSSTYGDVRLPRFSLDGNSIIYTASASNLSPADTTPDLDIYIATIRRGFPTAVVGSSGDDTLEGSTFRDDLFDGGTGADTMAGYAGWDTYIVDDAGDLVIEIDEVAGDIDKVYALVSFVLPTAAHVEELTTSLQTSTMAIDLTGNGFGNNLYGNDGANVLRGEGGNDYLYGHRGSDELFGGDGNDTLIGGAGFDLLTGGAGDEVYIMEDLADTIIEAAGGGFDTVYANFSFNLAPGQEIESLSTGAASTATTALTFTGNEFGNTLYANNGANNLAGGGGDDSLFGLSGGDSLFGDGGADRLYGGDGDDALSGGAGIDELQGGLHNDLLDGGLGADLMSGASGDDIYIVDDAGDVIVDGAPNVQLAGDRVLATVSYVLTAGADVEILSAAGPDPTAPIDLTGNEYNNNLWGNEGTNTLDGGLGNDWLFGFGGDDVLLGGAGNDFLIAGAGTDSLTGGDGNDVLQLDDALDTAFEAASGGYDTLYVNFSHALAAGQEFELLSTGANTVSTAALDLAGNEFGQIVIANDGTNTVDGLGGDDRLFGLGGSDVLDGDTGVDRLYGGAGSDTLTGGADGDFFFFDAPIAAADTITDFVSGSDAIMLARSQFAGIAEGAFPDRTFTTGTSATDPSHRLIYDNATGWVYFDEDGLGGAGPVHFLTLTPGSSLNAADFLGY